MIYLAKKWGKGRVSLPTIAKNEKISLGYLERIFSILLKNKIIISEKGISGGYKLSKSPARINIYDIISSLEGKLTPFHCLDNNSKIYCGKNCQCGVTIVLSKVDKAVNNELKNIKLSQILNK